MYRRIFRPFEDEGTPLAHSVTARISHTIVWDVVHQDVVHHISRHFTHLDAGRS